eukprot:Protomagalhaensia_wolfi_Nauph_80__4475@NODE_458_length_2484_cov_146_091207_g344_i0_p1_GENE_NODE_458_length_2484_cov_146_091207_g344_i0NODE_458_length_2484_cov_146_091207_g344_i0_p1_ORF_typecomplete_len455_score73_97SAM_3/PF18016_1/0_13_NODE_458_length_2484_cov_146_091207_g344_i010232387
MEDWKHAHAVEFIRTVTGHEPARPHGVTGRVLVLADKRDLREICGSRSDGLKVYIAIDEHRTLSWEDSRNKFEREAKQNILIETALHRSSSCGSDALKCDILTSPQLSSKDFSSSRKRGSTTSRTIHHITMPDELAAMIAETPESAMSPRLIKTARARSKHTPRENRKWSHRRTKSSKGEDLKRKASSDTDDKEQYQVPPPALLSAYKAFVQGSQDPRVAKDQAVVVEGRRWPFKLQILRSDRLSIEAEPPPLDPKWVELVQPQVLELYGRCGLLTFYGEPVLAKKEQISELMEILLRDNEDSLCLTDFTASRTVFCCSWSRAYRKDWLTDDILMELSVMMARQQRLWRGEARGFEIYLEKPHCVWFIVGSEIPSMTVELRRVDMTFSEFSMPFVKVHGPSRLFCLVAEGHRGLHMRFKQNTAWALRCALAGVSRVECFPEPPARRSISDSSDD